MEVSHVKTRASVIVASVCMGTGALVLAGWSGGVLAQNTPGVAPSKPASSPVIKGEFAVLVEGAKQGVFKGEGTREASKGRILGVKYQHEIKTPGGGKVTHLPVVITKPTGAATPQFLQAATTGEELKRVEIEFYKAPSGGGTLELWYSVKLSGARVENVRQFLDQETSQVMDEVSIAYQRIEVEHVPSKTKASDGGK